MSHSVREELERLLQESLIAEILKIDAKILARLADQCCDLRQKINATDRLRRSYPGTSSHAPSLIQRAV